MNKISILSVCMMALAFTASAQKRFTTYIAGNFGLATAKVSTADNNSNFSTALGIHAVTKLSKKFDLVLQPVIQSRGYHNLSYNVKTTYIDIPVSLEYRFDIFGDDGNSDPDYKNPFFVGAGVYAGLAVAGKYKDKFTDVTTKMKFGESATDNRSALDFGLNLVAGMRFNNFRLGFQNQIGSKNVVPTDRQNASPETKLRNFSFFIAYKLSALKKR